MNDGETAEVSAQTRAMLARLVGFDTTSHKSNLELIHYVRDYLAGHGVEAELVFDETGGKANLYATLGPSDRPGIALSGHTDVVPVDGQDWSSDPWQVREAGGRLYGRGTCDMKGFLAVVLAFVPRFLDGALATPIHLCLSHDEEVGCVGVRRLLAALAERPVRPAACIIGEPTDMKVVTGHKGKLSVRCSARGLECHSSLAPKGVNAVEAAARVVARLSEMAREKARAGPFDPAYDVPHTTIHTGLIAGGTALNIVPLHCAFDFEIRPLPGEDARAMFKEVRDFAAREVEPAMHAVDPATGFSWEEISAFPGMETDPGAEVAMLARALAGANDTAKVAFGTEGGRFQEAGIPCVVCGPGSIDQAHKPDEFVALDQLARCETFMDRLVARVRAS